MNEEIEPIEASLDGTTIFVLPVGSTGGGMQDASFGDTVASLDDAIDSIQSLATSVRKRLADARADKTTVEFSVGFTGSTGKVFALLGTAEGSGSVKVTLEWTKESAEG